MRDPVPLHGARILVTGATGQVAFPLIQSLAASATVYGLARLSRLRDRERIESVGAIPVAADLAGDDLSVVPDDIDYVVHMAVVKSGVLPMT